MRTKNKFKINTELIKNKLTKDYIKSDDKLEYIFKIILGSFNKKRKKALGVFTENTVILFNKFVDTISSLIDKHLNRSNEIEMMRAGLLDFGEFFSIEYDKDAAGEVYPDVYAEFDKDVHSSNKKKKGKDKLK